MKEAEREQRILRALTAGPLEIPALQVATGISVHQLSKSVLLLEEEGSIVGAYQSGVKSSRKIYRLA